MSWNSYNAFMDNLGKGDHLVFTLLVPGALMVLAIAKGRRDRRRPSPSKGNRRQ